MTQSSINFAAAESTPLDDWAWARDERYAQVQAARYVSPSMTGYEELDAYGDWIPDASYGTVWAPRAVPVGWAPYRHGRWRWVSPWGWTWVTPPPGLCAVPLWSLGRDRQPLVLVARWLRRTSGLGAGASRVRRHDRLVRAVRRRRAGSRLVSAGTVAPVSAALPCRHALRHGHQSDDHQPAAARCAAGRQSASGVHLGAGAAFSRANRQGAHSRADGGIADLRPIAPPPRPVRTTGPRSDVAQTAPPARVSPPAVRGGQSVAQTAPKVSVLPAQPLPGADTTLTQPAPIRRVEPRPQPTPAPRPEVDAPRPKPHFPQETAPPYQQLQKPFGAEPARTPPAAPPTVRQPIRSQHPPHRSPLQRLRPLCAPRHNRRSRVIRPWWPSATHRCSTGHARTTRSAGTSAARSAATAPKPHTSDATTASGAGAAGSTRAPAGAGLETGNAAGRERYGPRQAGSGWSALQDDGALNGDSRAENLVRLPVRRD